MRSTLTRRFAAAGLGAFVLLTGMACSSDGGSGSADDGTAVAADEPTGTEPADAPTPSSAGSGSTIEALTGQQICDRLPPQTVGAAIGLDVGLAEADDSGTPQCAYEYTNGAGATSNLTVASMRPDDVGGLTGNDAYEFVLDINRQVAGDTEVEESTLDAGDGATVLMGASLYLGVLRVGDRVVTLIVPAGDATPPEVEALITKMATTLS